MAKPSGAPSTTERREIHRKSAFRRNDTKNKTVLRTASENRHGKRRRWWPSTNAHNWLRFPASQHLGTRPRTRRLLANLSSSREQDRETNGLIDGLGTRTPSAAHQTIAFTRTRQRNKRSHRRAGNKDPERCSPNDRKRCRIRDRSHRPLLALRIQSRRTEPRRARLLLYWELNSWARGEFWAKR
jgi:hypothetical protein